jgi:hypothetical protein
MIVGLGALSALAAVPAAASAAPRARAAAGSFVFQGRTDQCPPDLPKCGRVTIRIRKDLSSARFFLEWEARCHPNNGERNLRERHKIINLPLRVISRGANIGVVFSWDRFDSALYKSKPGAEVPLTLQVDERIRFSGRIRIYRGGGSGSFRGRIKLVQTTPGQTLRRTCTPEGQKVINFKVKRVA